MPTDHQFSRAKALKTEIKELKELLKKKNLDKLVADSNLKVEANKLVEDKVLKINKKRINTA